MTPSALAFLCAVAGLLFAPPPARAEEAAAARLSREEIERFLCTAKVVKTRAIDHGVTMSVRATLSDGTRTHDAHLQSVDITRAEFKTDRGVELNFRDSWKFNVAAYRLGVMLGIDRIPVSVERKVGGKTSAVTWWVDDVMMDEATRKSKGMPAPDPDRWNRQMHLVRVFDALIYNTDRNLRNLLITKSWDLWMIDHTRAFRVRTELRDPVSLVMCGRALLAKLRELDREGLERELKRYLTRTEIGAILARRDRLVAFFEERAREKGEAAVFYD